MADLTTITSSVRDTIGRYFTLISAVPSAFLVAWVALLVESGAWTATPDFARAVRALSAISIGGVAWFTIASLGLGLLLHPIQFAVVQLLEGYWGASTPARILRTRRILGHWHRVQGHNSEILAIHNELRALHDQQKAEPENFDQFTPYIVDRVAHDQELRRIVDLYPNKPEFFLPTRLGNVLRRYEWQVGRVYGIEAVTVMPYLARAAEPADLEYVNDQRSQLDLAVRMCLVSFLATTTAAIFLGRHGLWLLIALLPYGATYLAYRGAVIAAGEYGRALGVLIALNRFALYKRLHLPRPRHTAHERSLNQKLGDMLSHRAGDSLSLDYDGMELPDKSPDAGS